MCSSIGRWPSLQGMKPGRAPYTGERTRVSALRLLHGRLRSRINPEKTDKTKVKRCESALVSMLLSSISLRMYWAVITLEGRRNL